MSGNVVPIRDSIGIPCRPPSAWPVGGAPSIADAIHLRRAAEVLRDEAGNMRNGVAGMGMVAWAIGLDALADGLRGDMAEALDEAAECWGRR